ncbi:MAG: response regulator [Pseudomonadota bacterium]
MTEKGKVLFVDDEKRVLNSMRGLFRRDYELFLTTDGAEAVDLVAKHDIDVIVADQRMPGLTGVEVLGQVREVSPRTVRILLTGYADPKAIEGSINVGEVFRFLSKPCQPNLLRETVKMAIDVAQTTATAVHKSVQLQPAPLAVEPPSAPAPQAADAPVAPVPREPVATSETALESGPKPMIAPMPARPAPTPVGPSVTVSDPGQTAERPAPIAPPAAASPPRVEAATSKADVRSRRFSTAANDDTAADSAATGNHKQTHWQDRTEIVMSGDTSQEVRQLDLSEALAASIRSVGVAVFTVNPNFAESAIRSISTDRSATLATTLVKVAEVLEQKEAGVLVTDFSSDIRLLQNMIGALKRHLPELVTIVVSEHRDASDMINLINYGQVFRYVEKPIDSISLRTDVNAAVIKHLQLLEHPDLVRRHQVVENAPDRGSSETLSRFIGKVTQMRGRWVNTSSKTH